MFECGAAKMTSKIVVGEIVREQRNR